MDWRPVQGVSCLLPDDSWDRLQHPPRPRERSGLEDVPTSSGQQEILKLFEAFERRVLLKLTKMQEEFRDAIRRLLEKSTDQPRSCPQTDSEAKTQSATMRALLLLGILCAALVLPALADKKTEPAPLPIDYYHPLNNKNEGIKKSIFEGMTPEEKEEWMKNFKQHQTENPC
ncbi:hypothetical protein MHYP_G00007050 [Metynnis hypsauchen]